MAATSKTRNGVARFVSLLAIPLFVTSAVLTQSPEPRQVVRLPANATALEGVPQVRIDATKDHVIRRELDAAEAAKSRLTVRIVDGRFYWGDRTGSPLNVTTSGMFTYLSSTKPGRYIRIQQLNDRLSYVEHVDMDDMDYGTVTFWGELRVVLKK
jgi:hypothetical protein